MTTLGIRPYRPDDAAAWRAHLATANNATLFHDLDFLAYHPPGRFDFHHLIATRGGRIEAVLPGFVRADGFFVSPAGASIGGPVVGRSFGAELAIELIGALQAYALERRWSGIELTIPPPVYHQSPNQVLEFALHAKGFWLAHRSMPLMVPLDGDAPGRYQQLFNERKRSRVRASWGMGVTTREAGIESFATFIELFEDTYGRLGETPTHTPAEIEWLLRRFPDCIRLRMAWVGDTAIAGVLLFELNARIANTFYICDRASHRDFNGMTALFADLIDAAAARGFRYIDLGPSASSRHFNRGVVNFKQQLGAVGFCRDCWRWDVSKGSSAP